MAMEANKHHAIQTVVHCTTTHCANINTARDCKISNSMELNGDLLMNIGNIIFSFSLHFSVVVLLKFQAKKNYNTMGNVDVDVDDDGGGDDDNDNVDKAVDCRC